MTDASLAQDEDAVPATVPSDYSAFEEIDVCGNVMRHVEYLFEINGNYPLLIGKGFTPYVWMYVPANATGTKWIPIIERNVSLNSAAKIQSGSSKNTNVTYFGKDILVYKKESNNKLIISDIDFRPIGINIYGNKKELNVVGAAFQQNVMSGTRVFFGINSRGGAKSS